jgi:hypothetical protein
MLATQPVLLYVKNNCVRLRNNPGTCPGQPTRGVPHACGLDEELANSHLNENTMLQFAEISVIGWII